MSKYFVGRVEANQIVSAYVENNEKLALEKFQALVKEEAKNAGMLFTDEQIGSYFQTGCVDFDSTSVVVRPIDNDETCPIINADFLKPVEFFQINGQQQNFEIPGQTRSMIIHLTYGVRRFSLVIDEGGIVLANGHLRGNEPRDPIQEEGFLWINPHYLREDYEGEAAPTDELRIHTYDYRPNSSDEPVFSGRVNIETGAVEDVTEK